MKNIFNKKHSRQNGFLVSGELNENLENKDEEIIVVCKWIANNVISDRCEGMASSASYPKSNLLGDSKNRYTKVEIAQIASISIGIVLSEKTWNCVKQSVNLNEKKDLLYIAQNTIRNNQAITYLTAQKLVLDISGINFDHVAHNPFYIMACDAVLSTMRVCCRDCYEDSDWDSISRIMATVNMKKLQKDIALKCYMKSLVDSWEGLML